MVDLRHRLEMRRSREPDEGLGRSEIGPWRRRRCQPLQRVCNTLEKIACRIPAFLHYSHRMMIPGDNTASKPVKVPGSR